MLNDWLTKCLQDTELAYLKKNLNLSFLIKVDKSRYLWKLSDDSIEVTDSQTIGDVWSFTLDVPADSWGKFLSPSPPPFHNTLQAMIAHVPGVIIEGDRLEWAQSVAAVERICTLARSENDQTHTGPRKFLSETIQGRYVRTQMPEGECVLYYEEAGTGDPIIFLHTAGSDSRQYKHLLGNEALQKHWHMYAVDMPFHGRSEPPEGWWKNPYQLTTQMYTDWIIGFIKATGLADKRPIISGSSMGGAIVLYLAAEYGDLFKAAISIEGGFGTRGRYVPWTNHPKVNGGRFLQSWVAGLMAPDSPEYERRLTLWEYSQGAPGVYQGDTYFYSQDWPSVSESIGTAKCPLWILTGEYDYSCTPEMSRQAAERMGGQFIAMKGIGHFPMAEHPELFMKYLSAVLDDVRNL